MIVIIAAALAMAACDGDPGDQPGRPTTDASDAGKGDNPYQPETTTTTAPDATTNDTFTPPLTAEELCGELIGLQGTWWCESDNHLIDGDRLDVTVKVTAAGDQCELIFACDGCGTRHFFGKTLPLSTQYTSGIYEWTSYLFIEGEALIREDVRADVPDSRGRTTFYR